MMRVTRRWAALGLGAALAGAAGCGTDVAQTAVLVNETTPVRLDCTAPATPPELPSDPSLGGGTTITPWVLAKGEYDVDQGPGVVVAARDGFRLFVNGHLLATGTASLVPTFVPLTLLPGDNAVSVVVTPVSGPAALLARVDELERPYVSDASWKVSHDPTGDWSDAGYDDSGWAAAHDRGPPSENPECDPGAGFPNGSDAHWIAAPDAGTAVFRKRIRIAPVGFGEGTTGGSNAEPVLVAHDDLDGLVEALKSDTPGVVVLEEGLPYDVHKTGDDVTMTEACPTACDGSDKMTLNLLPDDAPPCAMPEVVARNERKLHVGSNKTLVGLGRGAQLLGGTLALGDSQNVVVRNVALYDINPDLIEAGDGISIDGADGVWVDHVTFKDISDGFIDATKNSKNLTFSWVRNDGDNPKACLDRHPRSNELSVTTATIHHTLWEHVNGRAPLATHEGSRVHLFDNVVSDFVGYAVGSACGAEVLLETSTFDGTGAPTLKATCSDAPDEVGSIGARGLGNRYSASVGPHQVGNATAGEPNDAVWRPTYAYTTDGADTSQFVVPQRAGAGSRWRLPIPPAP